jgi:16S rRNA (cytidine1402-2'-O)-methyltransferase
MKKGKLYLIPNTLGGEGTKAILPEEVMQIAANLKNFIVEDVRSARRLLRKVDRNFPIDEALFLEINKHSDSNAVDNCIDQMNRGTDFGLISEAGCPGIADPGAELIALAHENHIEIKPLVGPSSILLALISSGFSGQQFSFHGYLPKDRKERIRKLRDFEADARRTGRTHIFMDTPFRNMHVLDDLLNELSDSTMICIASALTWEKESIKTRSVLQWREEAYDLSKLPTIFIIGKTQIK